jgi:hypothetical protein
MHEKEIFLLNIYDEELETGFCIECADKRELASAIGMLKDSESISTIESIFNKQTYATFRDDRLNISEWDKNRG